RRAPVLMARRWPLRLQRDPEQRSRGPAGLRDHGRCPVRWPQRHHRSLVRVDRPPRPTRRKGSDMIEPLGFPAGEPKAFEPTEFDATIARESFVRRNPLAAAGIVILSLYVLMALLGPLFVADPITTDPTAAFQA